METDSNPSVLPNDLQDRVDQRVRSGRYASVDDVVRAALGALDREEWLQDDILRRKVEAALGDPRPNLPAEQVFAELRGRHEEKMRAVRLGV